MTSGLPLQSVGDRPRLLIIEPNRSYLGVLARRLGELGYRIATAEGAQASLAEMYRVPVDLVLCEINLPGTSGIELARMVRDDPVHRDVPIVLLVGRSDPAAAIRAFRAGADGVVRKPCHFEVLGAAIARQIERAEALRRLSEDNAVLDARVINRAIELREMRERWSSAEKERRRLAAIVEGKAA
ncbi:MAG TPA: response regulator [Sphingomicrobium sp.]|nr:response regulator [Sphingomicrobium sp.]